jgi:hypothetical protein
MIKIFAVYLKKLLQIKTSKTASFKYRPPKTVLEADFRGLNLNHPDLTLPKVTLPYLM